MPSPVTGANPALTQIVAAFGRRYGTNSDAYRNLVGALNVSAGTVTSLNSAAGNTLTAIEISPNHLDQGSYEANVTSGGGVTGGTIDLEDSIINSSNETVAVVGMLDWDLAHEAYHADNSNQWQQNIDTFQSEIRSDTADGATPDLTSAMTTYQNYIVNNEANAELSGWNAYVAAVTTEYNDLLPGGSVSAYTLGQFLFANNPNNAREFIDQDGNGVAGGPALNADFTANLNASNVAGIINTWEGVTGGVGPFADQSYIQTEANPVGVAIVNGDTDTYSFDFSALHLTAQSLAEGLGETTGDDSFTIVDTSNPASPVTYDFTTSSDGAVSAYTSSAAPGVTQVFVGENNGADTIGSVVGNSDANVLVGGGYSTSIEGSGNTVTLNQGATAVLPGGQINEFQGSNGAVGEFSGSGSISQSSDGLTIAGSNVSGSLTSGKADVESSGDSITMSDGTSVDIMSGVSVTLTSVGGDSQTYTGGATGSTAVAGTDGSGAAIITVTPNPIADNFVPVDGDYVSVANNDCTGAEEDPLVVVLSGTVPNLTGLSSSSPSFDFFGGRAPAPTGWIGDGTGLLAISSGGATIEASNLFGPGAPNGIAALAALDSNHDGVIDSSDASFANLVVWQDANNDAVSQSSEIETLTQLGISSISLDTTSSAATVNGNQVRETAVVTMTDGTSRELADVIFAAKAGASPYDGSDSISSTAASLPNLQGYGQLSDLRPSMTSDALLLSMVATLAAANASDAGAFDLSLEQILFRWAGVDGTDPSSRGPLFDAQKLGFLESFLGFSWGGGGALANPEFVDQTPLLSNAFDGVFAAAKARFLVQDSASPLSGIFALAPSSDTIVAKDGLAAAMLALRAAQPAEASALTEYWVNALTVINDIVANEDKNPQTMSSSQIASVLAVLAPQFSAEILSAAANGTMSYIDAGAVGLAISGAPIVYGTHAADMFDVTAANLTLVGQGGGDEFLVSNGAGNLEVNESDPLGAYQNTLKFGAGITADDLVVSGDTQGDLLVEYDTGGDQVKLDGMMSSPNNGVGRIAFADGTSLTAGQLDALATTGAAGHSSLYGGAEAEVFDPNGYAHFVQGGGGGDRFVYDAGYGNVEISEDNGYGQASTAVVQLGAGLTAANLTVSADPTGNLLIADGTSGDQIKLDGEIAVGPWGNAEYGVAAVQFSDGSSLTRQQLIDLVTTGSPTNTMLYGSADANTFDPKGYASYAQGNGGADTFVYQSGYGSFEINDWQGTFGTSAAVLSFGPGITASSTTASTDGSGNLFIQDGVAGDQVELDEELDFTAYGYASYGVAQATFADGSSLTRQQLINLADTGSATNTHLYGSSGADAFDSKGLATYAQGNGGADTFVYDPGYRAFEINENNGSVASTAELLVGAGISASDLTVTNNGGYGLVIGDGTAGDSITLDNELFSADGVTQINLADGTVLTRAQLIALASTGSAAQTQLQGGPEADTFDPNGYATLAQGGGGADTFTYKTGYGAFEISENNGNDSDSTAVLQFGPGITAADLTISLDASGNLFIADGTSGDQIKLDAEAALGIFGFKQYGVTEATFTDGSSLTRAQLIALADTGSPTNTRLYGTSGADTFDSKGYATYAQGNGGSDTFVYDPGYGALEINQAGGAGSVLQFGAGVAASQLSVSIDGSGNLTLTDGTSGDSIKLDNELTSGDGVAEVTLTDGSSLTRQNLLNLNTTGVPGKTSLVGTSGAETFDPNGYATYEQGNGGADTFVWKAGYGQVEVSEDNGGFTAASSTLQFAAGITASSLSVSADSSGNMFITDGTSGDQIKLDGELAVGIYGIAEYGVAQATFADGSSLSRQQLINMALTGSSTKTSLYGSAGADTFDSEGYATYEHGDAGADAFLYSSGWGALEISEDNGYGAAATSTLQLGAGITAANLTAIGDSSGNITLYDGVSGDAIKLDAEAATGPWGNQEYGVAQLTFAGGTSLTKQQIVDLADIGSATNTRLYGSSGGDVFDSKGFATYEQGNGGADVFDYGAGYGALEISENNGVASTAVIDMAAGITAASLTIGSDASGNFIITDGVAGDRIVLDNALWSTQYGIVQVDFSDGSSLTRTQMANLALTGSAANTMLYGTASADTFTSNGYATYEQGNGGGDTFLYQSGWGHLEINEDAGFWGPASTAVLQFGSGITAADVTVSDDTGGDVIFTDGVTGDRVRVDGMLSSWWGRYGVGSVTFGDATSWTFSQLVTQLGATKGGLSLSAGDGSRTFDEAGLNGNQTLNLGAGITASDVLLQADSVGDLTVELKDTGDKITFLHDLVEQFFGVTSVLSQLTFADGSTQAVGQTWLYQPPLALTYVAGSTVTTLTGSNFGNNTFVLGAGGDTVTAGNTSQGGPGVNTFDFTTGDGGAVVNMNGGTGIIKMGAGITASDVILQADNSGDLTVVLKDTGDAITFQNDLAVQYWGIPSQINEIAYADGSTQTLGQTWLYQPPLSFTWIGSSTNTTLTGSNFGNNTFDLGAGMDTVTGGTAANTFVFSPTGGSASITLNGGTNELDFGNSITDEDLWFAQSGNDLTIDEMGTTNLITIKDWYSGASHQLQEITAGSLKLDSQISQLVSAMATFSAADPSFNPMTATGGVPSNRDLDPIMASAWHS